MPCNVQHCLQKTRTAKMKDNQWRNINPISPTCQVLAILTVKFVGEILWSQTSNETFLVGLLEGSNCLHNLSTVDHTLRVHGPIFAHHPGYTGLNSGYVTGKFQQLCMLTNDVWGMGAVIAYWWRVTTGNWVVVLIGWRRGTKPTEIWDSIIFCFCYRFSFTKS